ncbi:MAG: NYN domain-containing protein [Alphaproteobacteria bacterium]
MKVALLIDGGYLRACASAAKKMFDNKFIEKFAHSAVSSDEYLLRIFYYDAPQFRGKVPLPVSNEERTFQASDKWLDDLARLERFAVRKGTLGFRGWKPRTVPIEGGKPLTDADFSPIFEQKGVDMRIGLDIAAFAQSKAVDRIVLVSGDQDMIPAMKVARKSGLEVAVVQLPPPTKNLHDGLHAHSDFVRSLEDWPTASE